MIELHVEDAPSAVLQPDQAQVIRAVSPTIDAERTEEGALLTIHDIDGEKTITVYDGEQGDPGEPGQDGVSPTVTVQAITGGHRIIITDADGTKTVDVMDGADGRGIASIAKTGTSGLVDTYTITYTDGTTSTFSVTNGQKGDPGTDGVDGVTFTPTVSAEGVISWTNDGGRTNPQPVDIKGPQGPKGDDYVLTAQDKQDIAELVDVPVQSVNGQTGAVVLDAQDVGAYEKPATGIPASDLAAGVIPAVPVQDVQVNGTSVVQDGVANVQIEVTQAEFDTLSDDVFDLESTVANKAPVIINSASGAIASFSDGADNAPVKSLIVGIEPVQPGSGDPSPDNVRPISGWTGANVYQIGTNFWDEEWEIGGFNYQTGVKTDTLSDRIRSKNFIPVFPGITYYFHYPSIARVLFYDADKRFIETWGDISWLSERKYTIPNNCYFLMFAMGSSYGTIYNNDISINYPSTDHAYHPYTGTTLPISWQSVAGTVYGGTLDMTNGALTVDRANIASYNGETLPSTWISDRDVYSEGTTPTIGAQVVYKLAEPVTYDLTTLEVLETLKGVNNIWADTGDTFVSYRADTKLYIEQITKPTEDDMIANTVIASGTYFMVGNRLFLATAAIANGATITPGTNATELSLADALNNLKS